jgi:type 1 glutamine amidotransferase
VIRAPGLALLAACLGCAGLGGATEPIGTCADGPAPAGARILVFSKTAGYRHATIPDGLSAIQAIGSRLGIAVEDTEDAATFTATNLARFAAVVFLSTTGELLDDAQQAAFETYIRGGGGFVGIHAAADAEYQWAWYGQLVGAFFNSHPEVQQAIVRIERAEHLSTRCLPTAWRRTDEWYDFQTPPAAGVTILATVDEATYDGGMMGRPHPIAWYHEFDGGRAWYTAMGHTSESYSEAAFVEHLAGGILWAATP